MKKKLYFVGFNGEELASLQSALARVAGVWDCVFFSEGSAALTALSSESVDAVVANAGQGSMEGAEFMHQAATRQPRTLRLILGDVAEQELIISCIGATHQFIAKPCKSLELIATIQRGLALEACVSNDQIRALAPKLRRLPSLPSTYFEVLKQVESSGASVQGVAEVIMRDPALTARLLQMVNSAAFALAQKVTDPADAVSLLGMETVRSLVLCLQVFSQNDSAKQSGISLDQLWDHSLEVAKMAREITLFQTGDAIAASEAFTAGLLHDVGRIVIASNLPKDYAETVNAAREQGIPLHLKETARFGVDHAQIGAYLMGLWGMPAALVEAAALHHTPDRSAAREFSLLTAVHAADVFAHEKDGGKDGLIQPRLDENYLQELGLDGRVDIWKKTIAGESISVEEERKVSKPKATVTRKTTVVPVLQPAVGEGKSFLNFLAPVAAAMAIVAAIFIWQSLFHSGQTVYAKPKNPTDAPALATVPPAPAPVPVITQTKVEAPTPATQTLAQALKPSPPPAKPVVARSGFDSIKLEGVMVDGAGSSVIINGKTCSVGDRINGVLVEAIDSSGVTLVFNGRQKIFRVK